MINPIRSWSPWSRKILNLLIFRNKSSLNRNWILFILLLKRKLAITWKGNCFILICFFCFKPSSSPTQLDFLGPSSPLDKQAKILTDKAFIQNLAGQLRIIFLHSALLATSRFGHNREVSRKNEGGVSVLQFHFVPTIVFIFFFTDYSKFLNKAKQLSWMWLQKPTGYRTLYPHT